MQRNRFFISQQHTNVNLIYSVMLDPSERKGKSLVRNVLSDDVGVFLVPCGRRLLLDISWVALGINVELLTVLDKAHWWWNYFQWNKIVQDGVRPNEFGRAVSGNKGYLSTWYSYAAGSHLCAISLQLHWVWLLPSGGQCQAILKQLASLCCDAIPFILTGNCFVLCTPCQQELRIGNPGCLL